MKEFRTDELVQNYSVHVEEIIASPVFQRLDQEQENVTPKQEKALLHLLGFDIKRDMEVLELEEGQEYKSLLTGLTYSGGFLYVGYERLDKGWKKYGKQNMIKFLFEDGVEDTIKAMKGEKNV